MFKKLLSTRVGSLLIFSLLAFLAGGISGLVGTGGGIILVLAFSLIEKNDKRNVYAATLWATVPISALALISYVENQTVKFSLIEKIWLPVMIGGVCGAFLTNKLRPRLLTAIFSLLVIYSGVRLVLG